MNIILSIEEYKCTFQEASRGRRNKRKRESKAIQVRKLSIRDFYRGMSK